MNNNFLKILNLEIGDSLEKAKAEYRKLVLKYHPDKCPNNTKALEKFREATEAYVAIKNNPNILNPPKGPLLGYIKYRLDVTIEDFYFRRIKNIGVTRRILCYTCLGTGSKYGKKGICTPCDGKGKIDNPIMAMLNNGEAKICPLCEGTGIIGPPCGTCGGQRYLFENVIIKLPIELKFYDKKVITIKHLGHIMADGSRGIIFVYLNVEPNKHLSIEEDFFKTNVPVSYAQRVLGDRGTIELFGRSLRFNILPGEKETQISDRVSDTVENTIHINFLNKRPKLSNGIRELYERIRELEKSDKKEKGTLDDTDTFL